jgi:hypothetical protein
MSRNPIHTVLVPCALLALFAVMATAPIWAQRQAADCGALDAMDDGSDADHDDDGSWTDGALAVHEHRSIHFAWSTFASIEAALTHPALDARERVSMNGGRRL